MFANTGRGGRFRFGPFPPFGTESFTDRTEGEGATEGQSEGAAEERKRKQKVADITCEGRHALKQRVKNILKECAPALREATSSQGRGHLVARHGPNAHRVDRAGSQSGHIEPQARRFCAMPRTKCVPRRMHRISIRPHRARGQASSLTVGFSLGSFSCLRGLLLGLVWERLAGSFWEPVRGGSGVPSGTFSGARLAGHS